MIELWYSNFHGDNIHERAFYEINHHLFLRYISNCICCNNTPSFINLALFYNVNQHHCTVYNICSKVKMYVEKFMYILYVYIRPILKVFSHSHAFWCDRVGYTLV